MLFNVSISQSQAKNSEIEGLSNASFSDLTNIAPSVGNSPETIAELSSKRPEYSFTTPAAIYVITQENIESSGLRSIPEILRMAPGLQVAQSDNGAWAITSRGFNSDGFGNKLLVLIDGRTVYTPLFSGVYWDAQDTFIDDIKRIEVIRGPGATLWGANAVNGVINIITKSSKETQTNVASAGIGKTTNNFKEARHGGVYHDDVFYRVYGKHFDYTSNKTTVGKSAANAGDSYRSGFRADWGNTDINDYTVQGDVYKNHQDISLSLPDGSFRADSLGVSGNNILSRWNHKFDNDAKSSLQVYFDRASADYSLLHQDNYTADIDYQYDININNRNSVIAGVGYRFITDDLQGSDFISYSPTSLSRSLYSAFLQDTYKIIPDKVHFTLGSKFEHNDFTGFEVEPSARLAWYPNNTNTLWASVSRAVRTPNRSEEDLSLAVASGLVRWQGNSDFKSEELIAYELGYRIKPTENLLFDATTFINKYNQLRTNEISYDNLPSDTVVGLPFDNKAKAISKGFELASTWSPIKIWKLKGSYTFLTMNIEPTEGSTDTTVVGQSGVSPKNQFNIQSQLFLPHSIELTNNLYYVDNLPNIGVPSYYRFDSRIMWTAKPGLELSLVGQNLLDKRHQEFSGPLNGLATDIGRNVYGKVTVRF